MASGGARNRTGHYPDPSSARSDQRGIKLRELPVKGYRGYIPVFPLPDANDRELDLWKQMWRTPQAAAWASEKWRQHTVAMYVRVSVRSEDPDAPAGVLAQLHRFADQIGMTPAGLKENGWAIADPAVVEQKKDAPARKSSRAKLKVV